MAGPINIHVNAIYCGDCQAVLHNSFPDNCVDLIYVDPPFFSNKNMSIYGKTDMNLEPLKIGGEAAFRIT
jgi:DNA modification methylase